MENLYETACNATRNIDTNSVDYISKQLNQQIEYSRDFECGKKQAAQILFDSMFDAFKTKIENASENGKNHVCIMTVSTSPLTAHLATHIQQNVPVHFEDKVIKYSYLAIFWTDVWKKCLEPFVVSYKWNSNKTLLYVNLSWNKM